MSSYEGLPRFFRVRQQFDRPTIADVSATVASQLSAVCRSDLKGRKVAITAGSRGIANIATIIGACVSFLKTREAIPLIVPAMGSHGGATAHGQTQVLASLGITEESMGCRIASSMDVDKICTAAEGFPVYFDSNALDADDILVVNRIKPHTRFAGDIESGLMKMMLIGLGKKQGAEVYHRVIANYSFDRIVRSVANEVIGRCNILAGLAVLENAYEETADIVAIAPSEIESREPELLRQVKLWMPSLPFDHAELLMIDEIGKNISGTGMDTNIVGRKKNDHAAINGDSPDIHHIYVRGLTEATHGNASGIGLAELCHQRVVDGIDLSATRTNCITAGHVTGAMLPIDFSSDYDALVAAMQLAGFIPPQEVAAMWIPNTLHLQDVECSEVFFAEATERSDLEIVDPSRSLEFDTGGDLKDRF